MTNKHFSASHIMLYVILLIYFIVVVVGIVLLKYCIDNADMDTAKVTFTALASMTTICGSTTAGFYALKASRENTLQIKYAQSRMRLKLAKRLFKEIKNKTLDEKSVQLLQTLLSNEREEGTNYTTAGIGVSANINQYSDERGAG